MLVLRRDPETRGFLKIGHPLLDRKSMDAMPGRWRDTGRHDILILEATTSLSYYTPDNNAPRYMSYLERDVVTQELYLLDLHHIAARSGSTLDWYMNTFDSMHPFHVPFTIRKDQAIVADLVDFIDDSRYLVMVKWAKRAVTCGIWAGDANLGDVLERLDLGTRHPFPTKARSRTGEAEIRVLILTRAHEGPGKCYQIGFRRLAVKSSEEAKPEEKNLGTSLDPNPSTAVQSPATQALNSVPEFLSTYSGQRFLDDGPVGLRLWFDQLWLRRSGLEDEKALGTDTNSSSDLRACDGDSQGGNFRDYSEVGTLYEEFQQTLDQEHLRGTGDNSLGYEAQTRAPRVSFRFILPTTSRSELFRTYGWILLGMGAWGGLAAMKYPYPRSLDVSDKYTRDHGDVPNDFFMAPASMHVVSHFGGIKRKRQEAMARLQDMLTINSSELSLQSKRGRFEFYENFSMGGFKTAKPPLTITVPSRVGMHRIEMKIAPEGSWWALALPN